MSLKHLISENKVLVSFSIARRINENEINKINKKLNKKCKSDEEYQKSFRDEVVKMTQKALDLKKIPGIINPESDEDYEMDGEVTGIFTNEKRIMILNFFATAVAKKMLDQKFKKDEICFVLLSILTLLGLTDEDFRNFHKNNRNMNNNPNDDEGGIEPGEDDVV